MDNVFTLNSKADAFDIYEAINRRISKGQSIVSALLAGNQTSEFNSVDEAINTMAQAVSAIGSFLDEVKYLHDELYRFLRKND